LGWCGVGIVALVGACGERAGDSTPESGHYDYAECSPLVAPPDCEGLDCAEDEAARAHLELLLDVVDRRGYADIFTPESAEYLPATNQLLIDYQLQVDWMRTWGFINLKVPATTPELRSKLEAHVDAWEIPDSLADPDDIVAAVEGCDPILEVDPCDDFWDDFTVHASHEWSMPGCVYKATYAIVDARTAEVIRCVVEEEYGCEEDDG
jgi:hypothetical protein